MRTGCLDGPEHDATLTQIGPKEQLSSCRAPSSDARTSDLAPSRSARCTRQVGDGASERLDDTECHPANLSMSTVVSCTVYIALMTRRCGFLRARGAISDTVATIEVRQVPTKARPRMIERQARLSSAADQFRLGFIGLDGSPGSQPNSVDDGRTSELARAAPTESIFAIGHALD
jgi:hypothetical protein